LYFILYKAALTILDTYESSTQNKGLILKTYQVGAMALLASTTRLCMRGQKEIEECSNTKMQLL
jgi:hypothetical protein